MDSLVKITLYENLLYASIALAAVGLLLAIFFFFYFKIPLVFAMETGRAQRKTIEKMMKKTSASGSLRIREQPPSPGQVPMDSMDSMEEAGTTAPLSPKSEEPPPAAETTVLSGFRFEITQSVIVVHTDEIL